MNRKLFGLSCMTVFLGCALVVFIGTFIGTIVFSQAQAGSRRATATLPAAIPSSVRAASAQPAQGSGGSDGAIEVVVITATPQPEILSSPTPPPPVQNVVGTDLPGGNFPFTVTAEYTGQETRVAQYKAGVYATWTEVARENVSLFASLTAAAPTPRYK